MKNYLHRITLLGSILCTPFLASAEEVETIELQQCGSSSDAIQIRYHVPSSAWDNQDSVTLRLRIPNEQKVIASKTIKPNHQQEHLFHEFNNLTPNTKYACEIMAFGRTAHNTLEHIHTYSAPEKEQANLLVETYTYRYSLAGNLISRDTLQHRAFLDTHENLFIENYPQPGATLLLSKKEELPTKRIYSDYELLTYLDEDFAIEGSGLLMGQLDQGVENELIGTLHAKKYDPYRVYEQHEIIIKLCKGAVGDIDLDGISTPEDQRQLAKKYLTEEEDPIFDINQDKRFTLQDIAYYPYFQCQTACADTTDMEKQVAMIGINADSELVIETPCLVQAFKITLSNGALIDPSQLSIPEDFDLQYQTKGDDLILLGYAIKTTAQHETILSLGKVVLAATKSNNISVDLLNSEILDFNLYGMKLNALPSSLTPDSEESIQYSVSGRQIHVKSSYQQPVNIYLYNVTGQLINRIEQTSEQTIDTRPGIYILHIENNQQQIKKKIQITN